MRPRAVIFDCDGVLVDSPALAGEVLAQYLGDLGFEVTPEEATRRFGSGKLSEYVGRFERETGRSLPADFEQQLRKRRDEAFSTRLRAVPGAHDLVRSLSLPSCVASNGPMAQIEHSLRIVGLHEHFVGRIFSAYTLRAWKPDPRLFLHASSALGVPPHECVVIEDSELGVEAGLTAGMQVFAFLPGGGTSSHTAARTLRHLADLRGYLE